jgi:PAS domain S-box-containing protein
MSGIGSRKVLISERDIRLAEAITAVLRSHGWEAKAAHTSDEVIDSCLNTAPPDLLLLEAGSDGTEGPAMAKRILEQRDIPVIFLCKPTDTVNIEHLRSISPYGCVQVPCDDLTLVSAAAVALEFVALRRQLAATTEEHRASELRFRRLFFEAPIGVAIVTFDMSIKLVNGALCAMLGRTATALTAMSIPDITHPDDLQPLIGRADRLSAGATGHTNEVVRFRKSDGAYLYTRVNTRVIRDESGTPLYFFPMIEDITAEHQHEQELIARQEQLEKSNAMFRLVIETIPVRLFWKDQQLRYIGCNSLFAHDAGYQSPSDLTGKDDFAMSWREQAPLYQSDDREVMQSGAPKAGYEEPQTTPDGETIWLRTTKVPLRDIDENVVGIFGTYEDVTDRKKAYLALQQKETILRSFIAQTGEGIAILDTDGTILEWNHSLEMITGIPRVDVIGLSMSEVLSQIGTSLPEELNRPRLLRRMVQRVLEAGPMAARVRPLEGQVRTLDGERRHVEVTGFPITTGDERRIGLVIRDTTLEKKGETELIRARNAAEESSRAKTLLLNNLTHEFRTPVNGILGIARILHEDQEDPTVRKMADSIINSASRLYNTLDALLKLARLTSKEHPVGPVMIPLSRPVEHVIEHYRARAAVKGIEIQCRYESDGLGVYADEEAISDILSYLVDNAMKFTKAGSVLIDCTTTGAGENLRRCIQVLDTGIGIVPEHLDEIFKDFKQISEGKTREYEGCGVGLSVAKMMAECIGGEITVASEIGKGSIFSVYLPVAPS